MLISHHVHHIYMGCCNKWCENANHCQEFITKTVEIRWILRCKFLAWKSSDVNFLTNIMSVRLTKKMTFWVLNVPMVKMLNWTKYFARSPLDFTRCSPTSWTKCSMIYATSQQQKTYVAMRFSRQVCLPDFRSLLRVGWGTLLAFFSPPHPLPKEKSS